MEEDMNLGEQLRDLAEENQTRKILEILNTCETLEEAKEKPGRRQSVKTIRAPVFLWVQF